MCRGFRRRMLPSVNHGYAAPRHNMNDIERGAALAAILLAYDRFMCEVKT